MMQCAKVLKSATSGALRNANLRFFSASSVQPKLPDFDYTPRPYNGPTKEEVLETRKQFLNPALFHYYEKPVMIVEGKQQYLYDETGRRYLDAFGGIVTVSVGHSHPKLVKAVNDQNELIQHTTTIYLNDQVAYFGKELAAKLPPHLDCIYFVNSGSEANDLAILMARLFTGNYDVVALRNCYHGMSLGTMGLTAHATWKYPVAHGFGIHHALNPDPYRGRFGNDGEAYAADVKDLLETGTSGRVAAFFAESIQGVGGAVVLADDYLKHTYKHIRDHGGVCIADEVQAGFGRTGTHYWGFETQGVLPDIVTMAKGIGNGLPLAAVATTKEIAATLQRRIHFNTYGGNPVSAAAGRAVLEIIDEEGMQENCKVLGDHLLGRFADLEAKHDIIGHCRGKGLMLGMELVKDRDTKEPAVAETKKVFEDMKDMGVLIGKGGLYGNVFRIKPPMCWTKEDADFMCDALDVALSRL
ncbi:alanine-glyoxylate transaminase [Chloropicon primus]|uniref:alanine--glyoxylate transaminase n=1 Tax=Chloropicon primus TaxID=1764295 RepID=A0A5B8MMJ4_9CHLO|nr:alanine-glyoxylate transaminase [Chloropicon primus]UPQ99793.1 alanine-glyoxylate transaminase [Chloropicon primus]|eukprot:QDZ20582.1 alanine-glyoxylate transaminase [Chloropicon primus]